MRIQANAIIWVLLFAAAPLSVGGSKDRAVYRSLETFAEILTTVRDNAPGTVEDTDLISGAVDGLLAQLDPHSSYYDANHYQTMKEDQRGAFFGIGIMVGYQDQKLMVVSPMAGGPAASAGIRAGDLILKIDGVAATGMDIYEAIRLLRGEEGSPVRVTVQRPDMKDPVDFELLRAEIPSNNVRTHFMLDETTGYVALKDFGENAGSELREAILDLESQDMHEMILDLRGNPGGLLPRAIEVAGLFIPGDKLVVSTKGRTRSSNKEYSSHKISPIKPLPLVVLIDRGSASASEIVAGAIQDHDRGLIVGVNSWGKGLVQSVYPLAGGARGLALTTSRYYTPSGRNIQGDFKSLDAYFNPTSSQDQYFTPDQGADTFKTQHGREVRSARGITPDVYIAYRETPKPIRELDNQAAFFNFAADRQADFKGLAPKWQADKVVIEQFLDWLAKKDMALTDAEPHREEIGRKLTYQIHYISDPALAWRHLMRNDRHIQAAKDLFDQAQQMLTVYNGAGELPADYTTRLMQFAKLKLSPEKTAK